MPWYISNLISYILWLTLPIAIKIAFGHWCPNYICTCNLDWCVQIGFCPNVALSFMDHIWTEFQGSLKYIGKVVSGFIVPSCFLIETHALGPRKGTWYYAEELKLETNTVLNSPTSIQFPKSNEETSFLFREAWEDKNVITLITLQN